MCRDCVVTGKYIWKNYDVGFPNLITYRGNKMLGGIGMKNREKYRLFRMIGTNWENYCGAIDCHCCNTILDLFLDEEYEVDWNKVPVDTLVRVRNDENGEWLLRYFCEWDGDTNTGHKYSTFPEGRTSKTATYYIENWRFCDLVEDEDNGK